MLLLIKDEFVINDSDLTKEEKKENKFLAELMCSDKDSMHTVSSSIFILDLTTNIMQRIDELHKNKHDRN